MTDVSSPRAAASTGPDLPQEPTATASSAEHREALIACVELLFFAYRDFTGDADEVLEEYGFGRAHHRVLHFVGRNPGLSVAELLEILRITKQSLARVLRQLLSEGFVEQRAGDLDRRERRLFLTAKGTTLSEKLTTLQVQRIERALAAAGPAASDATRRFLFAMIAGQDQDKVEALIRLPRGASLRASDPEEVP